MKRKMAFGLVLLALLVFVGQTEAAGWVRWDGNEFPENFDEGAVFVNVGSGTREIVNQPPEPGDPNVPNYAMECRNIAGPTWGNFHYTTPDVWTNQDSTIEFRLEVRAYCAQMSLCNDPDVPYAVGVMVQSQDPNHSVGFYWALVGGVSGTERITSLETADTFVDFSNQNEYFTYRLFYDSVTPSADLYVWNKLDQQWDYLLTSTGYAGDVAQAGLYFGDWSAISMAGQYRIDYQRWTNDGLITLPESCGDSGTVFKQGDLNGDCKMDLIDFDLFAQAWMECTEPGNPDCQ